MPLPPVTRLTGRGVPFAGDDVDTDRIIPARFMKCVTFDGLGAYLFHDVRHGPDGTPSGHEFDDPRFAGATILFTGSNFGCGSSREHAPQALRRHGIVAIVGAGFAEIFFGNCTTLGLPCLTATRADAQAMADAVRADPAAPVEVDVAGQKVCIGDRAWPALLREGARRALVEGRWDAIADLLEGLPAVRALAAREGYAA